MSILSKSQSDCSHWLELELMPNGRAPAGWIMIPSWGCQGQGLWSTPRQPRQVFLNFFYPDQKVLFTLLDFQKQLPLRSWRPSVHQFHIECTLPWKSKSNIYVHSPLVNKQLIGISIPKWNWQWNETKLISKSWKPKACKWMSTKHVMNLKDQKYYKILISTEVIMYVTYHLKGPFVLLKWNLY